MKELSIEEKAKAYDEALNEFSDIQGYEGLYKINRSGEVLSVRTGKICCPICGEVVNKKLINTTY